jgi:hypothetical protein
MIDPWPEYWPDTWYSSDDVYIDYDDAYYLYNRRDPQVRLAITITLSPFPTRQRSRGGALRSSDQMAPGRFCNIAIRGCENTAFSVPY